MTHKNLIEKLSQIDIKLTDHDDKILLIFEYLKQLEQARNEDRKFKERKRIGFKRSEDN